MPGTYILHIPTFHHTYTHMLFWTFDSRKGSYCLSISLKKNIYSIYKVWGIQAPIERKNYKVAAISRILVWRLSFVLWTSSSKSDFNLLFQETNVGATPSNSILFPSFQIFQAASMNNSIKRGLCHLCLPSSRICSLFPEGCRLISKDCQHLWLKVQWKIRCSIVSSGGLMHIKHWCPELITKCLLLSIFLVLSLSDNTSQQKNLTLGVHLAFHNQRKLLWGWILWKQYLYTYVRDTCKFSRDSDAPMVFIRWNPRPGGQIYPYSFLRMRPDQWTFFFLLVCLGHMYMERKGWAHLPWNRLW
jgi:hypothetical protein